MKPIEVTSWRIMRCQKYGKLYFHVIGYVEANDDTIISGSVRKWDANTSVAVTDKKEHIRLTGAPKFNRTVENAWERWTARKGIDDWLDVSSRYHKGKVA